MSKADLIDRQAAIDALEKVAELFPWRVPGKRDTYDSYNEAWNDAIGRAEMEIESLPSAQPEKMQLSREDATFDCISRQAAIDAVYKCTDIFVANLPVMVDKADAYKALAELPSAQPEIIRCKDCKKRDYCRTSTIWAVSPNDDWYCADAERRTDEHETDR